MNRQQIIEMCACPDCGAEINCPCTAPNGLPRKASHVRRLYRAQDIVNGKPDRETGAVNVAPLSDRRCPICHKTLKTPEGVNDHIRDAHGMTRKDAKALTQKHSQEFGAWECAQSDDDFDVIEDY